ERELARLGAPERGEALGLRGQRLALVRAERAQRLELDDEPLALLARAPQARDLAVDERHPGPAERLPDPLAHGLVGDEDLAVLGARQRVEVGEQARAARRGRLELRVLGEHPAVLEL